MEQVSLAADLWLIVALFVTLLSILMIDASCYPSGRGDRFLGWSRGGDTSHCAGFRGRSRRGTLDSLYERAEASVFGLAGFFVPLVDAAAVAHIPSDR